MNLDDYYKNEYNLVIGTGSVGFFYRLYHKWLERNTDEYYAIVLEVGSGSGEHFEFVSHQFKAYYESDIRNNCVIESIDNNGRQKIYGDAEHLDYVANGQVDRLIATCILTHLANPEKALLEWRRVVAKTGRIDIYVPCEPGMLLQLAQAITTKRRVRKLGLDYDRTQYREHRNHYPTMQMLIKDIFANDQIAVKAFPFRYLNWHFKLFEVYTIHKNGE
jgi:phosphatidylethanolamine/phosphatidyl-N-methylethanolamine N-methyltransferase